MKCYFQPRFQHSGLQSSSEKNIENFTASLATSLSCCKRFAKAIWSHCALIRSEWVCSFEARKSSPGIAALFNWTLVALI